MVKKSKMFSIITVCYNEEKNIEKTCKSVVAQNFKDFEWIVIDGKSTDKTVDILKKYKKRMTVFLSEKDKGICDAYNKGINLAKGKYILFLNGGDPLLDSKTLENAISFMGQDNFNSEIYYGDVLYENGELVKFKKSKLNKSFFIKKTISHEATFIKKSLFKKYGGYSLDYKIVGDFEFWLRVIVVGGVKTKYLPFTVSIFKLNGVSSNPKFVKNQIKERTHALIKHSLITKEQAQFMVLKWYLLSIFKRLKIYNFLRKIFRKFFPR